MQPTNAEIQIRSARELGDLVDIILEEGAEPVSRREPFLEGYGALGRDRPASPRGLSLETTRGTSR